MKRIAWMVVATALCFGATMASAQSLGDAARANRKAKLHKTAATRHFDNDNLPTNQQVSVVGPEPSSDASSNQASDGKDATKAAKEGQPAKPGSGSDDKTATPEKKSEKSAEDVMKGKIEAQKQKIDELSKDLDVTQREYRLRAVEMYSDAGNRLRNAAQWDKDDAEYKKQIADKQATLDESKQQLSVLEEQLRTGEAPAQKQ